MMMMVMMMMITIIIIIDSLAKKSITMADDVFSPSNFGNPTGFHPTCAANG